MVYDVVVQDAVWDVGLLPKLRGIARYSEFICDIDEIDRRVGIGRVEAEIAVCLEVIAIDLWRE